MSTEKSIRIYRVPFNMWKMVSEGAEQNKSGSPITQNAKMNKPTVGRESTDAGKPHDGNEQETKRGLSCLTCRIFFENVCEQRQHFKTDWHRHNVKLRMENLEAISLEKYQFPLEDECQNITETVAVDEESKLVNMSLDKGTVGSPYITLTNVAGKTLRIYRQVVHHSKTGLEQAVEDMVQVSMHASRNVKNSPFMQSLSYTPWKWAILLNGGGYFASGIFLKDQVLCHKTYHRYTVRKKAGGTQSTHDGKGKKARSAGAWIRRNNEVALQEDIEKWISDHSKDLVDCQLIFVHAPTVNRNPINNGLSNVMKKDDDRIRSIPFTTSRPNFTEVKRVYEKLSTIYFS